MQLSRGKLEPFTSSSAPSGTPLSMRCTVYSSNDTGVPGTGASVPARAKTRQPMSGVRTSRKASAASPRSPCAFGPQAWYTSHSLLTSVILTLERSLKRRMNLSSSLAIFSSTSISSDGSGVSGKRYRNESAMTRPCGVRKAV